MLPLLLEGKLRRKRCLVWVKPCLFNSFRYSNSFFSSKENIVFEKLKTIERLNKKIISSYYLLTPLADFGGFFFLVFVHIHTCLPKTFKQFAFFHFKVVLVFIQNTYGIGSCGNMVDNRRLARVMKVWHFAFPPKHIQKCFRHRYFYPDLFICIYLVLEIYQIVWR